MYLCLYKLYTYKNCDNLNGGNLVPCRVREAPAVWSDDYFKIPLGETKYSDTLLNPWERRYSLVIHMK